MAATALKRIPEGERGSGVGVISAFYDLFVGVSSFAAGFVSKQYGYSAAFLMAAFALIAAALAGRVVFRSLPLIQNSQFGNDETSLSYAGGGNGAQLGSKSGRV